MQRSETSAAILAPFGLAVWLQDGFFLATNEDDATFFALRRAPGGVLEYRISPAAAERLEEAGAIRQPIPAGRTTRFAGDELVIPPEAFDVFNELREAGKIVVAPKK